MIKKIIAGLCVFTALFGLFTSNPTRQDFIHYVNDDLILPQLNHATDTPALATLVARIVTLSIMAATTQQNFMLFSIFEVSAEATHLFAPEREPFKILGVANTYIPLNFNPSDFHLKNLHTP